MNEYFGIENVSSSIYNFNPRVVDFEDKEKLLRYHIRNMVKKCVGMFEYKGLPDQITPRTFELQIQTTGFTVMFEHNGKVYSSYGGLGGEPDYNYQPSIVTVANPALNYSGMKRINWGYEYEPKTKTDGVAVVIPNDSIFYGLMPTHSYYASQLVENDLTLNCTLINTRLMYLLIAGDEDALTSLKEVISDLKDGKISSALDANWVTDEIKSLPFGSSGAHSNIVQLLEERQYIKGSWWNELGVQSNYNMKRETITSSENILNIDSLLPITDDMYNQRKKYIDIANKQFGLNITFDYSSAWKKIRDELKIKEDLQLKELEQEKSNQLDKDKGDEDEKKKED